MNQYAGQKIKNLRKDKHMSQKTLAILLGTTRQTISHYETGKKNTKQDVLFKLADIFKISINDFFPSVQQVANKKQLKRIINLIDDSLTTSELEQIESHVSYMKCKNGK